MSTILLIAFRSAIVNLISQGAQSQVKKLLARLYAAVQVVLAKYPASIPAACVVVSALLAKYGFSVSSTSLAALVSAVAIVVGSLVHQSGKAVAARKPAK